MANVDEMRRLCRCVELATEELDADHKPFGSVLVAADGSVRHPPLSQRS